MDLGDMLRLGKFTRNAADTDVENQGNAGEGKDVAGQFLNSITDFAGSSWKTLESVARNGASELQTLTGSQSVQGMNSSLRQSLEGANASLSSTLSSTFNTVATLSSKVGSDIQDGAKDLSGNMHAIGADMQKGIQQVGTNVSTMSQDVSKNVKDVSSKVATGVSRGVTHVSEGVARTSSQIATSMKETISQLQNLSKERIVLFFSLQAASAFFIFMAFFVGLPTLVFAPSKFAICFTVGSILNMSAYGAIRGWQGQIEHMLGGDRVTFTLAYISSMLLTLWAAMVQHSYILTVVFCAVQVVALLYYIASYFPGGTAGLRILVSGFETAMKPLVYAIGRSLGLIEAPRSILPTHFSFP